MKYTCLEIHSFVNNFQVCISLFTHLETNLRWDLSFESLFAAVPVGARHLVLLETWCEDIPSLQH